MNRAYAAVLVAVLACFVGGAGGHAATADRASAASDAELAAHALGSPGAVHPAVAGAMESGELVPVIVHLRPSEPVRGSDLDVSADSGSDALADGAARFDHDRSDILRTLDAAVRSGRATRVQALWLGDAVAVTAGGDIIRTLAARPDVRLITLDEAVAREPWSPGPAGSRPGGTDGPLWNVRMVRADDVWGRLRIDGTGVTIGFLDTGVDYFHDALTARYRGFVGPGWPSNAENWWCKPEDLLCGVQPRYPVDGVGHGTHVAGTAVAGDGVGVAPGARWIAARVCERDDFCNDSWIIEALQWMVSLDPDRRPDVINASLGMAGSPALHAVVRSLHEAGIVQVAAAGNERETLRAPAFYSETVAVGAVNDVGDLWPRSSFGRSSSGEVKPDLVAPGLLITSTVPGGGWARNSGTSMAAPHVAGTVALLLQARPTLSPSEVLDVLRRSATPLTGAAPDARSGWGMLNAYGAVLSVTDTGQLVGRVTDAGDGTPIPWAVVRVSTATGEPIARTAVDDLGGYGFDLAPGDYIVGADAFTYRDVLTDTVVTRHLTTTEDFALTADEPMGYFVGTLADGRTGARLEGRIKLEDVPDRFAIQADRYTGFSRRLPPGTYSLQIALFGYRVLTDTVTVLASTTVERDYRLVPAPRILLIDGDAWAYGSAIDYFRDSLRRLGYVYDDWRVTDESAGPGNPGGPPTADDLGGYDVVIWSSAITGPTFVGGARPISAYLAAGGRVILSGQDALCTDARTAVSTDVCNLKARPDPYVRDQLYVRVLSDRADQWSVVGAADGPLAGLTLTLGGADGLGNQAVPDVVDVVDRVHARVIATYPDGRGAAVLADVCTPHRAAALAFGLEGVDGRAMRDAVLGRLIEALTDPVPPNRAFVAPEPADLTRPAGATAAFTVTVHNTGAVAARFDVSVVSSDWEAGVWSAGFAAPLSGPIAVSPCASAQFGVRVRVPDGVPRGARSTTVVEVRGRDGGAARRVSLVTRTPAPVLLVDGDFGYDSEAPYVTALEHAGVAFDRWELGLLASQPVVPRLADLVGYPAVVWFTGDDWRPNGALSLETQEHLARYLDGGGRLYLSSEDYLSIRGGTPYDGTNLFHRAYLGVQDFVVNAGGAHGGPLAGAPGSVLAGVAGCALRFKQPEEDYSDWLIPKAEGGRSAILNSLGQAVGTEVAEHAFKSLFLAFDAGQLDPKCADAVISRALDAFSPLAGSRLTIDPAGGRTFRSGDGVRLRLDVVNETSRAVAGAEARWSVPAGGEVDPRSIPDGWAWLPALRELRWTGDLPGEGRLLPPPEITFTLAVTLPDNLKLTSTAVISGDGLPVTRRATWRVNAPSLRESYKSVPDGQRVLDVGDAASFAINIRNTGTHPADGFVVTDTLPSGLTLLPGSVLADGGDVPAVDRLGGRIVWRGTVDPGRTAALTYRARVTTYLGGTLRNHALVDDSHGEILPLEASVFARPKLLFPWLAREVDRDP